MRGASRASYADLRDKLDQAVTADGANNLGNELFAVVGLLDTEHGLRRALSDPGKPGAEKAAITRRLLHGRVNPLTEDMTAQAAEERWASSVDLADALERIAIEALVIVADSDNTLDELEDELFRFGRLVAAQPGLRTALADPAAPQEAKTTLLNTLLNGKVTQVTLDLINQMVAHPRGRPLPDALDLSAEIAAQRKQQLTALVRTAVELTPRQRQRLADSLAQQTGHDVHLNVVIDPSVKGGLSVQIGDELIDGTAATRLSTVRRKLTR